MPVPFIMPKFDMDQEKACAGYLVLFEIYTEILPIHASPQTFSNHWVALKDFFW
jgi:hypothetical protein